MKKSLSFFSLFVLQFTFLNASVFEMNENCRSAYREIFLLNFKSASSLLAEEHRINPENAAVAYVENYLDFMRAFVTEETRDFKSLRDNIGDRLEVIDRSPDANPWKNLAKAEMMLQLSVVKLKFKEYLSSGYYLRKSFRQIEENNKKFPDFNPNLKTLGFLHAIIGAVPENYKWLANLIGLRGTISQGAGELSLLMERVNSAPSYEFMFDEALFLRTFIATHLEKDPAKADRIFESAKPKIRRIGSLHVFLDANNKMASGNYNEALGILSTFTPPTGSAPLHYLSYMRGSLLLNNLDFTAEKELRKYVENYKGNSFVKSTWQKIAWARLLQNDPEGFQKCMKQVTVCGNDFTDEDKQAAREALQNEIPNVSLLRARLLFDGGNYNDALAELAGKPITEFPTLKDKLEYTYRIARIFDKKEQTDKAVKYYSATYENGRDKEWYFAANSALLLGNIYEEQKNNKEAADWYRKCLALRNHEYQNSIDQKAEAGLNRIGRK